MFFKRNLPGILWAGMILFLSGLPSGEFPESDFFLGIDKLIHGFLYCILVLLLIVGFVKQYTYKKLRYKAVPVALIIGISYGIIIELLQGMVFDGRSIEFLDIVANAVGCLTGVIFFYVIYGKTGY